MLMLLQTEMAKCGLVESSECVESVAGSKLVFHNCRDVCRGNAQRYCEYTLELREGVSGSRSAMMCAFVACMATVVGIFCHCIGKLSTFFLGGIGFIVIIFVLKFTKFIVKESVLVELDLVGIQQTKTDVLGRTASEVYHREDILDVVISEAVTMNQVVFYLAVIMKDSSVKPLFLNMMPRLPCLKAIYRDIQEMLLMKNR